METISHPRNTDPVLPLTWATLDWPRLDRLRARFLARDPSPTSYWTDHADLANYDFTYAQRIGWKWDAVLRELRLRGWRPPTGPLLDWGCGSGIAGRCVLAALGAKRFTKLCVSDRSSLAAGFALARARQQFPDFPVESGPADPAHAGGTVLVSHVLNELDAAGQSALRAVLATADAVLWVEPGTYADSRALIAWRESLRADFDLVAPCTHQRECGMLRPPNVTHWCHHFAPPPAGLSADADWVRFGQRAGIDLRSVPYSFLVLTRRGLRANPPALGISPSFEGWSRVIGEPRLYKGFAKILDCSAEDVRETGVQQRDNPEFFRALKKGRSPTLLHGETDAKGWKIVDETR